VSVESFGRPIRSDVQSCLDTVEVSSLSFNGLRYLGSFAGIVGVSSGVEMTALVESCFDVDVC
jgi:hypothetical protein